MCGDWRLQSTVQLGKQSVWDDPERWHQVFCVALTIEMDFRKITKQTETIRKRSYFYKYIHTHTHTHTPIWASHVAQVVKNGPANSGAIKRCGFNPWVRKIP